MVAADPEGLRRQYRRRDLGQAEAEADYHGDLSHWLDLHEPPAHIHHIDHEATTVGAAILDRAETFEAEWVVMAPKATAMSGK